MDDQRWWRAVKFGNTIFTLSFLLFFGGAIVSVVGLILGLTSVTWSILWIGLIIVGVAAVGGLFALTAAAGLAKQNADEAVRSIMAQRMKDSESTDESSR
jgi:hypothetical protein